MRHIHLEPVFINHIFAVASEGNSNRKLIQTGGGGGRLIKHLDQKTSRYGYV